MTIERMQDIMAHLGFGFRDYKNYFEFDVKGVRVAIDKALTRGDVEASLISIPYWYELACQSLSEEKKGGSHD